MRTALVISLFAMLAGCTVVPPQAWTFDPTRPQPKIPLVPGQVAAVTDELAQLQLERNAIRSQIANEPNVWERQRLYGQLHEVAMELSPLERMLAGVAAAR